MTADLYRQASLRFLALALTAAPCVASNVAVPESTATVDVQVDKEGHYSLGIMWMVERSPRAALKAAADMGVFRKGPSGAYIESTGVPITYLVKIYKLPSRELVFTQAASNPRSAPRHGGRSAPVASLRLAPGRYQACVTTIRSSAELKAYGSALVFGPTHHGK